MRKELKSMLFIVFSTTFATSDTKVNEDVRLPPDIIVHPESTNYRSDDRVYLLCEAQGVPAVEYLWEKNGERLDINRQNIHWIDSPDKGSIRIDPITALDEGYYQCFANNMYGTALSEVADIRRSYLEFDSSTDVKRYSGSVGEHLQLPCKGYTSFPKPSFDWEITDTVTDEGISVSTSERIQIDLDGTLHFSDIQKTDQQGDKIYKCIVRNSERDVTAGGSYSSITVVGGTPTNSAPELVYSTGDGVSLIGREHVLKCIFKGYSTPKVVSWSRESGKQLNGRMITTDISTTLTISNVQLEDTDNYICKGSNGNGDESSSQLMTVESVPIFKTEDPNDPTSPELKPMNLNKTEKESASFFCSPQAIPNASIEWLINGEPIDSKYPGPRRFITNVGTNLTIIQLCKTCQEGSDLMVVQCNISNKHGYSYSQGYLNVLEKTVLTVIPQDIVMEEWEEQVVFECDAKSDDSTTFMIIWKHKDIQIDETRPEYELKGHDLHVYPLKVEEDDRFSVGGKYTCEASNGYGSDAADATLTLPIIDPPLFLKPAGFSILDLLWVFLIILIIISIILLCILCYCCYKRNKGDEYPVDEVERKNGNDPEKNLIDNGFHEYQRPEDITAVAAKSGRTSWTSTTKIVSDDEASLLEYGEPYAGKFNEDGSFIEEYFDNERITEDTTV